MPKWMHERAEHILAKNPSMPKGEAFAIATQQSHALGKSPKSYGTLKGKEVAKKKYDTPGDDKKTANPGHLDSPKMASVVKAKGINRFGQLLSGSREKSLMKTVGVRVNSAERGLGVHPFIGKTPIPTDAAKSAGPGKPGRDTRHSINAINSATRHLNAATDESRSVFRARVGTGAAAGVAGLAGLAPAAKKRAMEKEASILLEREKCAMLVHQMHKDAGVRDSLRAVGSALTEPIPGTKPWLLSADKAITRNAKPATGKLTGAMHAGGRPVRSGKMSGGNVYDVSRQAAQMGL